MSQKFWPDNLFSIKKLQLITVLLIPEFAVSTLEPWLSGPQLSKLFLWSQSSDEYLLVMIKIHSYTCTCMLLKLQNYLKVQPNASFFLLSKIKSSTCTHCIKLHVMKNIWTCSNVRKGFFWVYERHWDFLGRKKTQGFYRVLYFSSAGVGVGVGFFWVC